MTIHQDRTNNVILIIIRHADVDRTPEGIRYNMLTPLNKQGKLHAFLLAEQLGKELKQRGIERIDEAFISPEVRSLQTMRAIENTIPITHIEKTIGLWDLWGPDEDTYAKAVRKNDIASQEKILKHFQETVDDGRSVFGPHSGQPMDIEDEQDVIGWLSTESAKYGRGTRNLQIPQDIPAEISTAESLLQESESEQNPEITEKMKNYILETLKTKMKTLKETSQGKCILLEGHGSIRIALSLLLGEGIPSKDKLKRDWPMEWANGFILTMSSEWKTLEMSRITSEGVAKFERDIGDLEGRGSNPEHG